jgi:hypothetical protein
VKNGPYEENLRGELALEQLHHIKDVTWPSVQSDIERNHVVEIAEVEIVACTETLSETGSAYGIRRTPEDDPVPISPALGAFPGRHRAWVLPISWVAVAIEPLDDEMSYLRAHRRDLFARQGVDEARLLPLTDLRLGNPGEFGPAPVNVGQAVLGFLSNRFKHAYFEGRFEHRRRRPHYTDPFGGAWALRHQLVLGTSYRIRPERFVRRIIEPVIPEDDKDGVGPYR